MPEVRRGDRRIHYTVHGEGRPLVLVPGIGAGSRLFGTLPRRFANQGFQCAAIDPVGIPPSGPHSGPYSFKDAALDLLAVCEALAPRVAIAGTSLGGKVALTAAALAPERIDRMVLLASAALPSERARRVYRFFEIVATDLRPERLGEVVAPFLFGATFHSHRPAVVADLIRAVCPTEDSLSLMAAQAKALRSFDGTQIAQRVSAPTLCLAGDEDTLTPPDEVEATARLLPRGRTECLRAAGHSLLLESAEAFTATVQFLTSES